MSEAGIGPHDDDRRIIGIGTPESEWIAWNGLQDLRRVNALALVPPGHRAVLVAPHPDDEVLGAGGLLASLASERTIEIIGVTDGGASHPGSSVWPNARLIEARRAERQSGLRQLGIFQPAIRLGFDDGGLHTRDNELADAIGRHLQTGDVVFAPWRLDGHPDHEATARATQAACLARRATLIEMPIWMWHWARPNDRRVPWSTAVRVDVRDHTSRKTRAIACHRTQTQPDTTTRAPPVIASWALARWLRPFEVFFR